MKKILTVSTLLVVLLMLSVLPVFAAAPVERQKTEGAVVTVYDITNEDTLHTAEGTPAVNIKVTKGENTDTVVVTYYAASLKAIEEDLEGRPKGYAWLGVRLVPNSEDYKSVKFEDGSSEELTFTSTSNSKKCEDYYVGVSKENLEKAVKEEKDLVYTDTLTWIKDSEEDGPTTKLTVIVKAEGMEVYDQNNENVEWNEETYKETVAAVEEAKKAGAQKDATPKTGI